MSQPQLLVLDTRNKAKGTAMKMDEEAFTAWVTKHHPSLADQLERSTVRSAMQDLFTEYSSTDRGQFASLAQALGEAEARAILDEVFAGEGPFMANPKVNNPKATAPKVNTPKASNTPSKAPRTRQSYDWAAEAAKVLAVVPKRPQTIGRAGIVAALGADEAWVSGVYAKAVKTLVDNGKIHSQGEKKNTVYYR